MFHLHFNTLASILIVVSSELEGEDIIILAALFANLVLSPVSACLFPTNISGFVVSIDGMRGWGFPGLCLQVP